MISIFPSLTNTKDKIDVSVNTALARISEGNSKDLIQAIRQGKASKNLLPCITWSGTFLKRNAKSLQEYSTLICLDFDNVKELQQRKLELQADPFVFACFISPSGTGLKALIKVGTSPLHHQEFFKTLQERFPDIDPSGKDLARVCFESFDPDLYHNPKSLVWSKTRKSEPFQAKGLASDNESQTVKNLLTWWKKNYSANEGSRNNDLFVLSCSLFRYGIMDQESILKENSNGLSDKEIKTIIKSAKQITTEDNTIDSKKFEPPKNIVVLEKVGKEESRIIDVKVLRVEDIVYIITKIFKHAIRFNEVTQQLEVDGVPPNDNSERVLWSRVDTYLKDLGSKKDLSRALFEASLSVLAQDAYHPVKDFFTNNTWNEGAQLKNFLSCFEDSHGVSEQYLKNFLFGSVERLFKSYQNPVLVLEGKQGLGKSYLVKWLATPFRDYYKEDGFINPDDKDSKMELTTNFIYEWGEANGFSRKEVNGIKSLLFSDNIRQRAPYGRYIQERKIIASIIMTKNEDGGFLRDETGNRRFNTLFLKDINKAYSTLIDPEQLWLEIYALWQRDKEQTWKNINQEKKLEIDEEAFDRPASWDRFDERIEVIDENKQDFLTNSKVHDLMDSIDYKWDRNKKYYQDLIVRYMFKTYGIKSVIKKTAGKTQRGYPNFNVKLN